MNSSSSRSWDNDSAAALLSAENTLFRKLRRAVVGIPVYNGKAGHPDTRNFAPETLANSQKTEVIGVIHQERKVMIPGQLCKRRLHNCGLICGCLCTRQVHN